MSSEGIVIVTDTELQGLKDSVFRLSQLVVQLQSGANVSVAHSVVDEAAEIAGRIHQALAGTQTKFRIQGGPKTGAEPK